MLVIIPASEQQKDFIKELIVKASNSGLSLNIKDVEGMSCLDACEAVTHLKKVLGLEEVH